MKKNLKSPAFWAALAAVIALAAVSVHTGVYDIHASEEGRAMLYITRIPRTVSLLLTGMAMSVSGLVMQFITQNRMVEPTTTGTMEWSGLGLLLIYLVVPSPGMMLRMGSAIVFSFTGTMIFFLFLQRIRLRSSVIVPLVGMMLGAVVSAVSSFLSLQFQASQVIESWFVGSFSGVQTGRYEYLWLIVIVTVLIYVYADRIAVAGLGKDVATNLGLNYNRVILTGTALISLAVGVVAAVIGNLPFLGLIVPNIVSIMRGDDVKSNLPWVALFGMGAITLCDILSRTLIAPFEVPVSLILGTAGAVVFLVILLRQRRKG
ncbi:MAG: iron chelate uptake ABC transporter family permease subunit [Lachnospiraceae bacterium]|nr:iron chelate uptake ABC transporter family permease subunit [Lachnospiraceae bacterium]